MMGAFSLDPETGNLWVGNDVAIDRGLPRTDSGDVAPMKVIRRRTGLTIQRDLDRYQ
jgi:hypothetical protein